MAKSATDQPDRSRFIQDVTIRNFKCFEELKIEGCGQFNLILGDNNVGKTSVLEALLVDENPYRMLDALAELLEVRGLSDPPAKQEKDDQPYRNVVERFVNQRHPSDGFTIALRLFGAQVPLKFLVRVQSLAQLPDDLRQEFTRNGGTGRNLIYHRVATVESALSTNGRGTINYAAQDDEDDGRPLPFVPSSLTPDPEFAVQAFSFAAGVPAERIRLLQAMQQFAPDLHSLEILVDPISGPYLAGQVGNPAFALPVEMFGEGSRKAVRILLHMLAAENDRLMIDEIDAGIHYSRFATLWRTTLLAAIANNVQLFITTHNVECLRALRQVLETEEFAPYREECRSFTLERLPDSSIQAFRYDYSQFEYAIGADLELRGRQL